MIKLLHRKNRDFGRLLENTKKQKMEDINIEEVIGIIPERNNYKNWEVPWEFNGYVSPTFRFEIDTYLRTEEKNIPFINKTNSNTYLVTGHLVKTYLTSSQIMYDLKHSREEHPELNMIWQEYIIKTFVPEDFEKIEEINKKITWWKPRKKEKEKLLNESLNKFVSNLENDVLAQIQHPHAITLPENLKEASIEMKTFYPSDKVIAIYSE